MSRAPSITRESQELCFYVFKLQCRGCCAFAGVHNPGPCRLRGPCNLLGTRSSAENLGLLGLGATPAMPALQHGTVGEACEVRTARACCLLFMSLSAALLAGCLWYLLSHSRLRWHTCASVTCPCCVHDAFLLGLTGVEKLHKVSQRAERGTRAWDTEQVRRSPGTRVRLVGRL